MLAVCAPVAVGANVTPTVHDAPPANELVQVLVAILNSALLLVTLEPCDRGRSRVLHGEGGRRASCPDRNRTEPMRRRGKGDRGGSGARQAGGLRARAIDDREGPGPSAYRAGSESDSDGAPRGGRYRGASAGGGKVPTGRYAGRGEHSGAGICQGKRAGRRAPAAHCGRAQGARRRRKRRGLGLSRRGDGGEENQEPKESEENASARLGNQQAARHRNLVSQQMCVPFQGS